MGNLFNYIFYIFLGAVSIVNSEDDFWWRNTNKLHDNLLIKQNYSNRVNPQTGVNHTTRVTISLSVREIFIDDLTQTLTLHAWYFGMWKDRRLVWDPKEYGDLTSTRLGSNEIWTPDLVVYNGIDPIDMNHFGQVPVIVNNNGWIWWFPPMVTKTQCPMDLTYYPYDTQSCYIYLGSWAEHGFQVDFIPWNPNATTDELSTAMIKTNHHWTLEHVSLKRVLNKYECCEEPYIYLEVNIRMKRSSSVFTMTVTFPAVAIALLVLVQFVLPVDYPPRVTVGISAALLTIIMLVNLSATLPPLGDGCPLIVKYYGALLMMTVFSISLSGVLARLAKEEPQVLSIPPPSLIKTILTGPLATVLCIRNIANKVGMSGNSSSSDGEDDILGGARKSFQHEWLLVAAAVDRVMALTYCIVIFFCCVSFLQ